MTTVRCPRCAEEFDVDDILYKNAMAKASESHQHELEQVRESVRKEVEEEFDRRLQAEIVKSTAEINTKVETLTAEKEAQEKSNEDLLNKYKKVLNENQDLKASEQLKEAELSKAISSAVEEALKKNDQDWELKIAAKDEQLRSTSAALDAARRKAQQGSEQTQGEVLEKDLSDWLQEAFHEDAVERVGKGVRGPDIIQTVRRFEKPLGKIVWEAKNAKWNKQWVQKLKDDVSRLKADVGVLVSVNLPEGLETFGYIDGVMVTSPRYAIPVSVILRTGIVDVSRAKSSAEMLDQRMRFLYEYITGPEFRSRVELIVSSYEGLKKELEKEKKAAERRWSKQEKLINNVILNTSGMYGDFQGILGNAVEDLPALEPAEDDADVTLE